MVLNTSRSSVMPLEAASTILPARVLSPRRRAVQRFLRNRLAIAGLVILAIVILTAVLAPWISPSHYTVDLLNLRKPPNTQHWLGTDPSGRDVFARVVNGARISMSVGIFSVLLYVIIGTVLGLVSGFYGGWVDSLLMRISDAVMALPSLLLTLILVTITEPNLPNIILSISLSRWPSITRLVRAQVLSAREMEYVTAARSIGVPANVIMLRHLLPNVVAPVIVSASFGVASAILAEASLSFLGLGVRPPTPSWGEMLNNAQSISVLSGMPWFWIPPGFMVAISVLSINFVGDGLRDALDPRTRYEER